jgi:hypothetical protein
VGSIADQQKYAFLATIIMAPTRSLLTDEELYNYVEELERFLDEKCAHLPYEFTVTPLPDMYELTFNKVEDDRFDTSVVVPGVRMPLCPGFVVNFLGEIADDLLSSAVQSVAKIIFEEFKSPVVKAMGRSLLGPADMHTSAAECKMTVEYFCILWPGSSFVPESDMHQ